MDSLIWAVVPAGHVAETGALRAHVVVTPRLESATLASAGMASWPPAELATARIRLLFAKEIGDEPDFTPDATLKPEAEPSLWTRYFPPDTPIRADNGPEIIGEVLVQPVGEDGAAVEAVFHAAVAAAAAPNGERLMAGADPLVAALERNALSVPLPPPPRFRAAAAREDEVLDFHDLVGLLREHPTVQKALGLILTVEISAPPPALLARGGGVVSVECTGLPAGVPAIMSPWTAYELSGGRFMAMSGGAIDAGMVKIGDAVVGDGPPRPDDVERLVEDAAGWRVLTVDVDAGVGALRDLSARIAAGAADDAVPVLPALRSGGIALARFDMGAAMNVRNARVRAANANRFAAPLDAEHLLLGYRLDVKREGDAWRSLSSREATYLIAGVPLGIGTLVEEGHIKAGAALDYGDGVLRTDDIVARWTGWNHSSRRPNFVASEVEAAEPDPMRRLGWSFAAVPGAQPRLRFGASYRLRLRVADIAGGGLALDDPLAERHVTGVVSYGRYEPVGSPHLLPPDDAPAAPGESVTDLVVRSDRGMTPAEFAAANPAYPKIAERIIEPPRAAIGMAEQHKMLDDKTAEQSWKIIAPVVTGDDPARGLALPDPAANGVAGFAIGLPAPAVLAWPTWPDVVAKRIVAQGRVDALEPELGWRGDDLAVVLAQAAAVTVELSSTLRETFEAHMAAKLDLDPAAAALARVGRHPVVTPAITIQVTHATRKPLRDPTGGILSSREAGATQAELIPELDLFQLDPESTAKVEIGADWTEPDDAETRVVAARSLRDVTVDRGDRTFSEPIVQEFGDTRHRIVRYTVRAISRFRHCFFADEPDEWFAAVGAPESVSIPNSARPAALKVLAAYPAFRWTSETAGGTVTHVREGLLRVALQRPWFVTGEGERLAVIVPADDAPAPEVQPILSEAGRDPIWATAATKRWPTADQFPVAAGSVAVLTPPGSSTAVQVVPHQPFFDPAQARWCCDIEIAGWADAGYAPLVRLALARYQPESLDGLMLSEIARTDFVPLMPRRTVTVTRADGRADARLDGTGPVGPVPNTVEFVVEEASGGKLDAGLPSILSDDASLPGWRQVGASQEVALGAAASMPLPAGAGRRRIRITEIEHVAPSPAADQESPLRSRVVFVDHVPLD
ncbi:hypothetical protein [Sphingomonas sp. BAUL-RG-20F-R05-02]|uniref:hypothetical protein n=1 Tax=Sphingomonas sp. BAUL-RG-20F-R05-02 TaxID=2914830 RepID=UPI001F55F6CC|nr:hypothetical protein [Sphingomonas sp. BAUL-RG-20F-R05-02]